MCLFRFPTSEQGPQAQAWALSSLSPLPCEVAVWPPKTVGHRGPSENPGLASDPCQGHRGHCREDVPLCPLVHITQRFTGKTRPPTHGVRGGLTAGGEQAGQVHGTSILQMSKTEAQEGRGRSGRVRPTSQGLAWPASHLYSPSPPTGTRTLTHTQAGAGPRAHVLAPPTGRVFPGQNWASPGRIEQNLCSGLPEPSNEGFKPPGRGEALSPSRC